MDIPQNRMMANKPMTITNPINLQIRRKVLFLCTGNSCRSQIAEAIVNANLGSAWQAFSAGTHPTGYVHPIALQVLKEIGIDHQGRSKSVEEFQNFHFDLVVTVCDSAAEECPLWLGAGKRAHLGFPDPARVIGSEEVILAAYRALRDGIAQSIPALLERVENAHTGNKR